MIRDTNKDNANEEKSNKIVAHDDKDYWRSVNRGDWRQDKHNKEDNTQWMFASNWELGNVL